MKSPLRIIYLEDDPGDVRLVRDTLEDDRLPAELVAVDTREGFIRALEQGADLVLADYSLPTFDGREALELRREISPRCPFIFVSGALGEERAIGLLKAGATDYILKDRLSRLCPAVRRALAEADESAARRRAEDELTASQDRLAMAADATGIGMFDWTIANGEFHWTEQHARLWDVQPPAAGIYRYCDWADRVHPDDLPRVEAETRAAVDGRRALETQYRIVRSDATTRWIVCRGVVQCDAKGQPQHMLGTVQDVTVRVKSEEALKAARVSAEAANRAKSQFLANMSHDLRTPMNAILGMTELALGEELSATVRKYLQVTKQSADCLLELLDQILDLSRIEAGRLQLEAAPFDLVALVEQVVTTLGVQAREKGIELRSDAPAEPVRLVGDPLRLRQVLMNLAGNAIKFTAQGEVVIGVESQASAPEEAVYRFSVRDTGIGIAPDDQERIFAPFTQADASTTREYGGSGLGLAISREIIALMGGRIWVESEPGRGSNFRFTACFGRPPAKGTPPAADAATDILDGTPPRPLRVLLAEDTRANQLLVSFALNKRGHSLEVVHNGQEAVEAVSRSDFDVVLMDVQMPVMDGYRATQAIRQMSDARKAALPIIAMTAQAFKGDAERCLAAGMDSYLSKPVAVQEMIHLLESLGCAAARSASASSA